MVIVFMLGLATWRRFHGGLASGDRRGQLMGNTHEPRDTRRVKGVDHHGRS